MDTSSATSCVGEKSERGSRWSTLSELQYDVEHHNYQCVDKCEIYLTRKYNPYIQLTPRQFFGKYLPRASIFIVIFQLILYSRRDL